MGLVAYQGKWERPDQVSHDIQDDPQRKARIQEYLRRRAQLKEQADDHWKLALWCEQNGLKEQASAHLHQVLRLDPKRESAWKHLGYKRLGGRWIKPAEAAAAKVEARQQQKANNHWKPVLERLRTALEGKNRARRAEAEKALSEITDRRAVPMVWATFARGSPLLQKVAVQVFGQIDDVSASRSLAILAVFGGSGDVRRQSVETLRRRDAREFAGLLIAMIQKRIKYTVKKVGGPGQPGELLIKGERSTPNLKRVYSPPPAPNVPLQSGDQVVMDSSGLPVINRPQATSQFAITAPEMMQLGGPKMLTAHQTGQLMSMLAQSGLGSRTQLIGQRILSGYEEDVRIGNNVSFFLAVNPLWMPIGLAASGSGPLPINNGSVFTGSIAHGVSIPIGRMAVEARKTAAAAQQQLQNDVDSIDQYNRSLSEINDRVVPVLCEISGQDLGPDIVAWQGWLNNLVGFNSLQSSEPPTITEEVPLAYQPEPIPLGNFSTVFDVQRTSCFGAGTVVRTLAGSDPIESLKLGDLVLTQGTKSGALAYKPILAVHHNPPSKTYLIKLGDDTIVSSYFHRFWKAGAGWVMARDLKVGDPIRTLSGTVKVTAIEEGRVAPVFNLDVADDADFFVGEVGGAGTRQHGTGPAGNAVRRRHAAGLFGQVLTQLKSKRGQNMFSACLLSITLLGADDPRAEPKAPARPALEAYRAAAAATGKNAEAQVRLALWCETHHLNAERIKHLALAVLYEPSNALARGLMGLVAYQGKWERPEQVSRDVRNDAKLKARTREYLERRAKAADRADDQWKLALWCEQNDLKSQSIAHLFRVLQLDPSRDAAWKHLGYKRIGGRWDKPERVAAARSEAEQQHKANKHWKPLLEKWREALGSRSKNRREQAEQSLAQVTDPRAVPMVWIVFAQGGAQYHKTAVRLLGQIDSPGSSRALALLALLSRSAEVSRNATQTLRQRDPRDFAAILIALLRDPIKYEVRTVNGPGSQGQLLVKGKDVNVKRLYTPLSVPNVPLLPTDRLSQDGYGLPMIVREIGQLSTRFVPIGNLSDAAVGAMFGLPTAGSPATLTGVLSRAGVPAGMSQTLGTALSRNAGMSVIDLGGPAYGRREAAGIFDEQMDIPVGQMMLDAQRSAQVAQRQLANDVQALDEYNAPIQELNQQVRQVLTNSTGVDQGPAKVAWDRWLVDLSGYAFSAQSAYEPPTVVEQVPISYQPQATPVIVAQPLAIAIKRQHACFGAGTLVRTLDGSIEIEKLRAGDLVLTQGPQTGELKYQPILVAYHNPPNATLRIDLGNETIVATGIHRLWKAGRGWVMARELKPGDALRTVGGLAVVRSVDKEQVQPVFNLQVADGESFFVGQAGVLAHDNSLVHPTPSPFDAVPELEESAKPRISPDHDGS